jgi:putative transposase
MKASKFSDAQKAFILKQGSDGMPVAEICRKAGIGNRPPILLHNHDDATSPPS